MRYIAFLAICLCVILSASPAGAKAIADSLAYQGSLTDASNNPVPDGPRDLTISIWTDSVAGTMLYSEVRTVTTTKGLFTTCIGCGGTSFPDIFDGQTLFLQLQLAGQAPMVPRTRLRGVPYSMSSSSVNASATQGSSVARALINARHAANFNPIASSDFDIDKDGDTKPDLSAETMVDPDSASCALSHDSNGDGVPEISDRRTVSANEFHHNSIARSGSTTATIRQMAAPDSASSEINHDSDGNGVPDASDRRTVSANEFHHNSIARSGSTTATIRQMATPDSLSTTLDQDTDSDGHPEFSIGNVIQSAGSLVRAQSELNLLRNESRLYSSHDSAAVHCETDPNGNGNPTASVSASTDDKFAQVRGFKVELTGVRSTFGSQCDSSGASTTSTVDLDGDGHPEAAAVSSVSHLGGGGGGAAAASYAATGRLSVDNNSDGTPDNEINSIVTPTASSVAINTKGTGADKGRTAFIASTGIDSAGLVGTYDANGDGIDETSFSVTVDSNGTALKTKSKSVMNILSNLANETAPSERKAGLTSTVDSDEDGVPDVDASMTVTPTTSSVAINTKGTGADKNRVVSTATPDGASLETSAAGKNIGIYVSATGGQSAIVMTDSTGGTLDTTIYIDGKAGRFGIGIGKPDAPLRVAGGAYCDGTSWVNASDRNAKENFEPVDGEELLEKIAELPITKWNYKGDTGTEHIGPTAQDFQETFGVGSDGKSISTIDPSGIALAGIKELSRQNRELQQQNRDLQKQNAELKRLMEELARKVEKLAAGK